MILGTGTDLVNVARIDRLIEKSGDRFLKRIYTAEEISQANSKSNKDIVSLFYAKRFAAKEAAAKALGTGISGGILFTNISVRNDNLGKPHISLTHKAQETLEDITPKGMKAHLHISLSDDASFAQAFVVIEAL